MIIKWISKESLGQATQKTFFRAVNAQDLEREARIESLVAEKLSSWQEKGLVPDMAIEPGDKTNEPIRTRGWTHWHHLFTPRDLLLLSVLKAKITSPELMIEFCGKLDYCSKLSRWSMKFSSNGGGAFTVNVFSNQALNTLFNWGNRSFLEQDFIQNYNVFPNISNHLIKTRSANEIDMEQDLFITDPPYADAVHYHEITEYFIAWLRKNPPPPFDQWIWDSRRSLAIQGKGYDFRIHMIEAYTAMRKHMPDNGRQCVMFTHQDAGVWTDMVGIFWAAGLQVLAAWYIATETSSELKKGGYVQGTVTLLLGKRPEGEKNGFKQRILPAVRREVQLQLEEMLHFNQGLEDTRGESVFKEADLQMAAYAAAIKVLTAYTKIS